MIKNQWVGICLMRVGVADDGVIAGTLIACAGLIAGKASSHRISASRSIQGRARYLWESALPAMASLQAPSLPVRTSSLASQLPQNFGQPRYPGQGSIPVGVGLPTMASLEALPLPVLASSLRFGAPTSQLPQNFGQPLYPRQGSIPVGVGVADDGVIADNTRPAGFPALASARPAPAQRPAHVAPVHQGAGRASFRPRPSPCARAA